MTNEMEFYTDLLPIELSARRAGSEQELNRRLKEELLTPSEMRATIEGLQRYEHARYCQRLCPQSRNVF